MMPAESPVDMRLHDPADASEALRLRRVLDEQLDLLALVEHELRNPLHGLSLQLALARRIGELRGQAEVVACMDKAQAMMAAYLARFGVMLQLARLPGTPYPLRPQTVDLSALLGGVLAALAPDAQYRKLAIVADLPPACMVQVDPLVIEQVVENLLLNAIKHSGCSVVTVALRCAGKHVEIAVSDDGCGIAAEDQERVFGKFAIAKRSPRGSGSGLGLWIVRKLIAALGGGITLRSEPGQGCVFTVSFELPPEDSEATP